jgi:hypothetical protein
MFHASVVAAAFSGSHCAGGPSSCDASRQFGDRSLESGDDGVVIATGVFGLLRERQIRTVDVLLLVVHWAVIADANRQLAPALVPRPFARLVEVAYSKLEMLIAAWGCAQIDESSDIRNLQSVARWTRIGSVEPPEGGNRCIALGYNVRYCRCDF